jgi:3-hydroxyisobutyrate dehydrogenase
MKIGFIGLGTMGRGMAANLQKAGHELVVCDVREDAGKEFVERGAVWAATPAEVASQTQVVFTSLPTPKDMEEVGFGENGLVNGFSGKAAWFDLSTNSVAVVRRLRPVLREQGIELLDAPVSGGPKGAASGHLAIWVGGDEATYNEYASVIADMSDAPRYIGEIGAGTIAKLCHNMASLALRSVVAEVITMGVKAGVDTEDLWSAIRAGAAGRARSFDNVQRFMTGQHNPPSFALRLAYKDAMLALELSRECEVPMKLCSIVALEMQEALNRGWGGDDSQSFLRLQQERAGVPPFELTAEQLQAVLDRD